MVNDAEKEEIEKRTVFDNEDVIDPTNRTKTQYPIIKYRETCYKME